MSLEVRPRRLTYVCRAVAALVLVVFAVLALLLPAGSGGGQVFGPADQIAFFGVGVLLAAVVLGFTRARVRADEKGVWVRNVLGDRHFPWGVVVSVDLPENAPWAQLELHDDETVALLAIQSNDGDAAVDAVLALRKLLDNPQDTRS